MRRVTELLDRDAVLVTTAINVEEIVRGLRPTEIDPAQRLFGGLVVLPVTAQGAWVAGQWRRDYAARGVTLSQPDCLIAAAVQGAGGTLVTGNPKDFPMCEVVHWPVGT